MHKKLPFTLIDTALLVFLFMTLTFLLVSVLDMLFGSLLSEVFLNIIAYILQTIVLLLLVLVFNKKYNFQEFSLLGFKKCNIWHALYISILAYITYFVVMTVVLYSTFKYDYYLPGIGEQEAYMPLFGSNILGVIILAFIAIILAPFLEELLFRGYVLSTLHKYFHGIIAIILSAIIFAGIHIQFEVFIPLFILGLILGYLRIFSNSIYYPLVFHMLNNAIAFIAELFLK